MRVPPITKALTGAASFAVDWLRRAVADFLTALRRADDALFGPR